MDSRLFQFRPRFDKGLRLLAMITLVVVAFLAFLNWRRFENALTSSERSRAVLGANGALLTTVKGAEAAMRLYVLTGEERDQVAYRALAETLAARQRKLTEVAGQPHQSELAARINRLAAERVELLEEGIRRRRQLGLESAQEFILAGGGRQKMAELEALVAQLFADEFDEQARMGKIAERRAFDAFLVAVVGCLLALFILLLLQRAVEDAMAQRAAAIADLAATSQRWEITLASIGDGVIATDAEGRVTLLNPVAERLTGWTFAEAKGLHADDVFRIAEEGTGTPLHSPLANALASGKVGGMPRHTELLPKQGAPVPIADSGSPIRTADGQTVGAVLVFRDIRESRESQRLIEKWYRLFRAGGFGMAVIDSETDVLLDLNPAFAAMHGYAEEDLRGRRFSTLLAASAEPHLRRLQERGQVTFESLHRHHDGRVFPVLTDMTTFKDSRGKATERAAYFSDISARILAERVSYQTQERFKTAVEVVGDIIWTCDADGLMQGEQKAWSNFTGQTFEEYRGFGGVSAVHPDDAEKTMTAWKKAVAEQSKYVVEHRLRRHDGVYRLFSARALPLFDEQGQIREWVGVHADITDEREGRQQLMESEARFRGLATALPQVIWSTKPDGRLEYTNPGWDEYLGAEAGGEWDRILHPEDAAQVLPQWQRATANREHFEFQARLRRASDGSYRTFVCRTVPLLDSGGEVIRWFGSCTDIDDQTRRSNEVKESNEALRRSNTDLAQFAYAASHDLQEPLRMVALYTQLLGEEYAAKLDAEAMFYINQAVKGAHRMETLLQALLAYSIVTAPTALESKADAGEAVRAAMQNLESVITRSASRVTFAELPVVCVPAIRLTQLFQNLIGNSIKYRRADVPPEVTIRAERATGDFWQFAVEDNGIGIEPEYSREIFGIFKRLHGQEYEGTGIGLAICQRIVENAGGTIWAESELGRGTVFHFTLPGA